MDAEPHTRIAAEDYLEALAAQGIEYLFANPGTDFAPIIEAFARAARGNRAVPRPLVVPHENAAVCMAHGYTMVTGRPGRGGASPSAKAVSTTPAKVAATPPILRKPSVLGPV